VAGLNFHIFQEHADRVVMANIAQMINVLQAMILTDHQKMIVTPTYHVFDMYKVHQDATLVPVTVTTDTYKLGDNEMAQVSASASKDSSGKLHLSLVNTHPQRPVRLTCSLQGFAAHHASGRVLTAEAMNAHNTFDQPDTVQPRNLEGIQVRDITLSALLPPKSVVVLELE